MADKVLLKKDSNNFFGRLLFIIIIIMLLLVYSVIVFNRIFIKISYLKNWFLYIIFGLLVLSLIIFLLPSILRIIKITNERRRIKKKEKIRKKEMLRLKKEKIRKLLEKEKERLEEKKPSIFSKLFKRKPKREEIPKPEEQKKGLKPKKEKIPLVKELSRNLKIDMGRYETDIDALYKIIEKTGRIKLSAISTYFGIDKRKAEEWATILQEHNLAEIHYPAIGEPELRKKLNK